MRHLSIVLLLVAAPVMAADTLPLARGVYVEQGDDCRDPAVAKRTFDGQGFGARGVGRCEGRVAARIGARYTLAQSCMHRATGPGRPHGRIAQRLKIRVDAPDAFTDIMTRKQYKLCSGARL